MKVQVFGLQRSGTNYLHWVIDKNLPVDVTKDGGWKHAFPWEKRIGLHGAQPLDGPIAERLKAKNIQPVVVCKDLEHWVTSVARTPKDYDLGAGAVCDSYEEAWRRFHADWASVAPFVRYESFLTDFEGSLRHLAGTLGVEATRALKPRRVPNSPKWRPEHKRRYV